MASFNLLVLVVLFSFISVIFAARTPNELVPDQPKLLKYHNGSLLHGKINIKLIWYGKFKPSQKAIITDFITSISSSPSSPQPTVATWWKTTQKYYHLAKKHTPSLSFNLKEQILDSYCSLGKSLTQEKIVNLASRTNDRSTITIILTAADVTVADFCLNRCGTHGHTKKNAKHNSAYLWVGNSETQCPGYCAWPFHKPIYGPQGAPLVAPNNDVGLDGMVINLASLLAETVTNPYGNGFYEGSSGAPLEAASACTGIFAKGAYSGYPGNLLVDSKSGASYNAHGANGREYLLPALFDPSTSACSTLV